MHGDVEFLGRRGTSILEFARGSKLFDLLDQGGQWFVVADFQGQIRGWRFADVSSAPSALTSNGAPWQGPALDAWSSSHTQAQYEAAVATTREHIRQGRVYQANICRVLHAPLDVPSHPEALTSIFARGNPAPYLGHIFVESAVEEERVWLASASPELFFRITSPSEAGEPAQIFSSPIKGTARTPEGLSEKDQAENVMITDLVRNDISHLCIPGSVAVSDFLAVESHPGLVHLVSTVQGEININTMNARGFWSRAFEVLFPPGSVSGAPKSSALQIISELESHPRGPYCGGFGWIDADSGNAELAVGIRSFWWEENCADCAGPALHFGSGAGITWGSDPQREWEETELKASRLIALASSTETP